MKKKVYRLISKIKLSDSDVITFEQKMNAMYFLAAGLVAYMFKKRNKTVCHRREVERIVASSTFWTGTLITIVTKNVKHILEMRSKEALAEGIVFLEGNGFKVEKESLN